MKSAAVAAVVLLVAAGAHAQQRHHGPQPSQPAAPVVIPPTLSTGGVTVLPPPPPPSPFDARPGTYAPHYNDPARHSRTYDYGMPFYGGVVGFGDFVAPAAPEQTPASDQRPPITSPAPEPPRAPEPVPPPPPVAVAHGPDTFYVIPGCYAGNRPPNPARLPKGCDLARLRTTPIR